MTSLVDRERSHAEAAFVALRELQTSRVWFEPYSDALNPIVAAIEALRVLIGLDNQCPK